MENDKRMYRIQNGYSYIREDKIEDFVKVIIETFGTNDINDIIDKLKGQITIQKGLAEVRDLGMIGIIRRIKDDDFEIIVDKSEYTKQGKVILAHLVGHLFLHMGYLIKPEAWFRCDEYRDSVYYRSGSGKDEDCANIFALHLVVPTDVLMKYYDMCNQDTDILVIKLMEDLKLFEEFVTARLKLAGLIPY